MPTFFAESLLGDVASLRPEDARHALSALRMKEGDVLQIAFDQKRYEAKLLKKPEGLFAKIIKPLPDSEASLRVTLYLGLTKGERMDFAIQKCTEIGAHRVVPCLFSRCVAQWEGGEKKLARWQRIAREAATQSGRSVLPEIGDCLDFPSLKQALAGHEQALLPWEEGGQPMRTALMTRGDLAIVIGPEGGITREEAFALPAKHISLGPRILRAETAAMVALSMALTLSGDMELPA